MQASIVFYNHLSKYTLATWCKELIHWKRSWCWEGLRVGGEGDNRGWDGWMASLTRWTWGWGNSGVGDGQGGLECCDSRGRKESDTTEQLNWTELNWSKYICISIGANTLIKIIVWKYYLYRFVESVIVYYYIYVSWWNLYGILNFNTWNETYITAI